MGSNCALKIYRLLAQAVMARGTQPNLEEGQRGRFGRRGSRFFNDGWA